VRVRSVFRLPSVLPVCGVIHGPRTGHRGPKGTKQAWHDCGMSDQEVRYDRIAEGYARWWSPVHRPATLGLLDEIASAVESGARAILDIGCGTGALLGAIVTRWPQVRATGVDLSAGMLVVAERELALLPSAARARITLRQGAADRLPVADGSADVAVSAFVYQLVPSRFRAVVEARRALAAGGTLAYATWLSGGAFPADATYDDALVAAGLEPEDRSADHDEPERPSHLVAQMRRAGFAGVTARPAEVDHRFTPRGYLAFVSQFDDEDRFASLAAGQRTALEADLLARLAAADPDDLRMRLPIAYVRGRRSARR
jgi:ubiquinone/menaquinone biosynthesis C-methylase UbiE